MSVSKLKKAAARPQSVETMPGRASVAGGVEAVEVTAALRRPWVLVTTLIDLI